MSKATVKAIAEKLGVRDEVVQQVIDALRVHVLDSLNASREVKITDFLTFTFKDVGDRVRRNPRTNERVLKEPARFPRVRFSAVFEGNLKPNDIPLIEQSEDETPKRGRRKANDSGLSVTNPITGPTTEPAKPQEPIPLGIAVVPPSPPEPEVIAEIAPPLPPVFQQTPPPLPEKLYRLTDQSLLPESQVRTLPPTTLIWHPDFGQSWKQVGKVFP